MIDDDGDDVHGYQILYQKSTVFPSPDIAQHSSPDAAFTLAPGVHEYPFRFKVSFFARVEPWYNVSGCD